jgi:hypothetical protein
VSRIKTFEPVHGGLIEMLPTQHGMVAPGVKWNDPPTVRRHLFDLVGKPVDVVIREVVKKDIRQMQKYWWAVPVPLLADHCGYTDSQMHYALLEECFGYEVGPKGVRIPNEPQSSYLSFEKWRRLIEWVLVWGPTELGVDIPPPNRVEAA